MYNCDRNLVAITRPTKVTPYEPSTIDFLSLEFSERTVVDVTIKKANNPPKVISISNGMFVDIKFVFNGELYKAAGKIQKITSSKKKVPTESLTRTFLCPCHDGPNSEYFIITIDCSDRFESKVFDIASQDIRDIDIIDMSNNTGNTNNCTCNCDYCHKEDPPVTPPEDNTDASGGEIDITPDTDLETDPDFGTDEENQTTDTEETTDSDSNVL